MHSNSSGVAINGDNSAQNIPAQSTMTGIMDSLSKPTLKPVVSSSNPKFVFIATALVEIVDKDGGSIVARALLDSGSQLNFITNSLIKRLGVETHFSVVNIKGIACASTSSSKSSSITFYSRINKFSAKIDVQLLPKISDRQPTLRIDPSTWQIPSNIKLADPMFYEPHEIDLLLGADIYFKLQSIGQIEIGENLPILQNTVLGWVVAGGTHISKLPIFSSPSLLGDSSFLARKRFLMLEKRLNSNPDLKIQYTSFISEYESLNHMSLVENIETPHYYLPHHSVVKPDSSTTKLRVVFDGSAKSSSGYSLNDLLMSGPVVQNELFAVLLRFRAHKYAFSADVC